MTKIQAQYSDLKKALARLEEALGQPPTIMNQDASIKRYEFTFELAWKLMQSILRKNTTVVYGVRNTFREAARLNLITDPKVWFDFLDARNLTVHTYKEPIARRVYKKAKEFPPLVKELLEKAKEYIRED